MTTSGTYSLTKTAGQIATGILRYLKVVGEGQSATAQQSQDVIEAINYWLLQQKGPNHVGKPGQMMWLRETAELSLVSGQYLYELRADSYDPGTGVSVNYGDLVIQVPTEIIYASLRDSDDVDTPLERITRREYEAISDKTSSGTPIKYHYEKRLNSGYFYVWQPPDSTTAASYTIRIVYRQPIEIITSGSQTLDIEDFWLRAIKFNVAIDVAPEYGLEPTQTMYNRAQDSIAAVNTFYPEDAGTLFYEPERD